MTNIVIIDKNQNSKELIQNYLKNMDGINNVFCYDNLDAIDCDLKQINVIIFDIDSKNAIENLVIVNELKNKHKHLNFIATSYEINSELVSKVLKQNISEFLLKPVIANILYNAIKKITDNRKVTAQKKAKTICLFSNKGGCGKTSIAVNTAYEIAAQTEEKVCLLDLSFNFGDIATFLNVNPKYTVSSVVQKIEHSDVDLVYTLCEKYKNSNLYVLSFQNDTELNNSYTTPQLVSRLISSLKNIFDYIVIDTLNSINETTSAILSLSDLTLLVGTINLISIRNCQKCLELFSEMSIDSSRIKFILNRYSENSEIKIDDIKNTIGIDIFHKIPNNYLTLIDAINLGCALRETNPHSNIAKAYNSLARELINTDYINVQKNYNHGIFNLLRRMGE